MSWVTTILMLPNAMEPVENVLAFRVKLAKRDERAQLFESLSEVRPFPQPSPSDFWGGTKVPEADVWGAALNYVSGHEVGAVAQECTWSHPVLFVWMDEDPDEWQQAVVSP